MTVTTRYTGDLPRTDPATAADLVASNDVILVSGFSRVGYPKAIPTELVDRSDQLDLTIVSGGTLGDEIDAHLVTAGNVARRYPTQTSEPLRDAINATTVKYHDRHLSQVGDEARTGHYGDPTVALVEAIAIGEDWLIPSASIGQTPAFIDCAEQLIVEVNEAQPLALQHLHDIYPLDLPPNRRPIPLIHPGDRIGSPTITFDPEKLKAVVTTTRTDSPYSFRDPTTRDNTIATHLVDFLHTELTTNPVLTDRLVLQFGVGSLGNALMHAIDSAPFTDHHLMYFGEVFQDGLLDPLENGTLSSASATSLALSTDGHQRLLDSIEAYTDSVILRNSNVSNHPSLIDRFGVVSINTALEVDLFSHVNATHLTGTHIVNGIGGGGDFTRNSHLSIIVLGSTANDGAISRIVPMVPHVDYTEHDVDIVITEQGVADLRGCSPRERARELIDNCAHQRWKQRLANYLDNGDRGGHIPHNLDACFNFLSLNDLE